MSISVLSKSIRARTGTLAFSQSITKVIGGTSYNINGNSVTWYSLNPGNALYYIVYANNEETGEEESLSGVFYTKPIFSWKDSGEDLTGGYNGDIINNFRLKMNELCEVAGLYKRWKEQNGEYDENEYADCKYKKDDFLSAKKFNTIAKALGYDKTVKKDDLITAKLFNNLINNVRDEE